MLGFNFVFIATLFLANSFLLSMDSASFDPGVVQVINQINALVGIPKKEHENLIQGIQRSLNAVPPLDQPGIDIINPKALSCLVSNVCSHPDQKRWNCFLEHNLLNPAMTIPCSCLTQAPYSCKCDPRGSDLLATFISQANKSCNSNYGLLTVESLNQLVLESSDQKIVRINSLLANYPDLLESTDRFNQIFTQCLKSNNYLLAYCLYKRLQQRNVDTIRDLWIFSGIEGEFAISVGSCVTNVEDPILSLFQESLLRNSIRPQLKKGLSSITNKLNLLGAEQKQIEKNNDTVIAYLFRAPKLDL